MKRTLIIIAVIGTFLAGIAYLVITRQMSEARANRLDRALLEAEARIMELEADLQSARRNVAGQVTAQSAGFNEVQKESQSLVSSSAVHPNTGVRVLYAATAGRGITNLVRMEGTSTVHDWQVEGHLIGGTAEFAPGLFVKDTAFPLGPLDAKASVFIPVRSLKSIEKSGRPYSDAMDEIMFGKLKAEEHKRILFNVTSLVLKAVPASADAPLICEATGQLVVAGVTNMVAMPVRIMQGEEGKVQVTGTCATQMTSFGITPPAPSVGGLSIRTGDAITLRFEWWVKPVQPLTAAR